MTAPAEAPAVPAFRVVEERNRFYAVDADDIEICGAFRPAGHDHFLVYVTCRLTDHLHHVIAPTPQIARWHVEMLADLATRAA